jgi:signal transduction histidine kinase
MARMTARSTSTRPASTLRRRLFWLLVSCGVVLGLVLVVAGVAFARLVDRQSAVTQTYFNEINQANEAYVQLIDAETGVRGYALTGDAVTLEPWNRTLKSDRSFQAIATRLARTGGDDQLVAKAQAAASASQEWEDRYARPLIDQVTAHGHASVTPEQVESGKSLFDAARSAVDAYVAELGSQRATAVHELQDLTRLVTLVVVFLAVAAVAIGVGLWFALKRWVIEPIDRLASDAREVAAGDLQHRVVATGPGEIRALATDLDLMRTTLVDQVDTVEAARTQIEEAHDLLAAQTEELTRSNRDLEQFAYVASHDLQEPLRKVASFTQLLQKRYGGQLDERGEQYIQFAVDGAKRMQRLIQDLLGFSRVGRIGGEVTDVDLDEVLEHVLDTLDEPIAKAGAVVTHDPLPTLRGEAPLLEQLFQNLVANAVKFRDPTRAPRVHVSAELMGDSWHLECRDNGIGIDPQYAERVFVIFQRLHPKDVYEGTGIGLALCKKIVEYHGGQIWIADDQDEGTAIRWTLPAAGD